MTKFLQWLGFKPKAKTPQQAPHPISRAEIKIVMSRIGANPMDGYLVTRRNYHTTTLEWIWNSFVGANLKHKALIDSNDLNHSVLAEGIEDEPAFKCTDHAALCASLARLLSPCIAFGSFWYLKDNGDGHAVCVAFVANQGPTAEGAWNMFQVVFFEPQSLQVVKLSQREIERCIAWIV